jgi:hypothetical protein
MADDALINLTRPQFENLMETQGLSNTVDGILSIANDELDVGGVPLTREALQNGTHPLLDQLDRYKGLAPEQRNISDEEILTLFTNVEAFGKYDPSDDSFFSPGTKAVAAGAAREIPETVGAAAGFKGGLALATPIAAMIPPVGLPGLALKGIVYGVGGIGGAIAGALTAGEIEDAVIGEAAPVVPSLEGQYRGGETGMIALSMLASPWKLAPSIPKAKTGAIEFLENFKNVSNGKYTDVADEAFQLAARDAGLSEKAAAKLFEKARNARQIASERGQMFGGALGKDLGFTKFNPAGYLFDPRKGPVSARVVGGIESGIEKSMAAARDKPGRFLGAEALVAGGSGLGAAIAQDAAPYDESARIGGELIGSLVVPIPVQLAVDSGPEFMRGVFRTMREWWGKGTDETARQGIMRGKLEKDAAERIISAIQKSQEYEPRVNPETGEVIETAEEQLNRFIAALGKAASVERVGPDGKPVQLTVSDLATMEGLPFSPTMQTIQQELAKSSADLRAATGTGREELQAGAINAVRALASTGDPASLAMAARIQQGLFEQNILDNVDGAVTNLTTAAGKVLGREPGELSQRTDLSEKLYDVLKNQIDLSKTRERRLWSDVKNFPLTEFYARNGRQINQPNVLQLLGRPSSRGGLNFSSKGAQRELDAALGGYKSDLDDLAKYFQDGDGRNPATAQKFFEMRSGLMNKAAQLRKTGDTVNAQRLDKINDALLRDLTGQRDGVSEAYNTARAYTFARNNVFTRSFLSDLQGVDRNRGLILDPQNLLDQAFRGGNLSTAKRFQQIRAAGRFLIDEAGFTEEAVRAMDADQLMSAALRDSLSKVMDKKSIPNPANPNEMIETFVVNPTKLENWKKQPGTQEMFALIPDLEVDLANAQSAQRAFDGTLDDITLQMKPSEAARRGMTDEQLTDHYGTKAFQWVLQFEDPGEAVAKALSAEKPSLALNALHRMVNEADYKDAEFTKEQALQGLKSAIFNNALRKANNTAGLPNGDALQRELFTQIPGVDPSAKLSMSDFLIRKGMATEDEMAEVQKMVKTIRGIDEAFATNNFENVLFKNPSMAKLFYLRIAGATAGAAAQNQLKKFLGMPQMSGGLIAEQTGSDLVQRLLLRGPETQRIKVMTQMFSNPKLLAAMMKEIQDAKMKDNALTTIETIVAPLARQTGRRLPLGIRAVDEDLTEEYEAPEQPTPPPAPVRQPTLPPANQQGALVPPARLPTQGSGAAPSPTQFAPATPQSPPSTPSGTVDRARFAALFPEDRDLMGIASLAGQR